MQTQPIFNEAATLPRQSSWWSAKMAAMSGVHKDQFPISYYAHFFFIIIIITGAECEIGCVIKKC